MDKMEAGRVKFESELSTIDLSARSSAQLGVKMNKIRLTVQLIYTILTKLKYACVPGLNCYSCPGAVASCPLGALQALLNQKGFQVPFAMLGFFFLAGSLLGRFICGWLCPFGLVQDLLHKIPFCQYLCPLGAIYGWFNRFSLVQVHWEKERCVSCGACERACPVSLSVQEISRSPECIRCGKCIEACPADCLHFSSKKQKSTTPGNN